MRTPNERTCGWTGRWSARVSGMPTHMCAISYERKNGAQSNCGGEGMDQRCVFTPSWVLCAQQRRRRLRREHPIVCTAGTPIAWLHHMAAAARKHLACPLFDAHPCHASIEIRILLCANFSFCVGWWWDG